MAGPILMILAALAVQAPPGAGKGPPPPLGEVSGRVGLRCTQDIEGRLRDCVVTEETPPGHNLARSVLRQVPTMRREPILVDGKPVEREVNLSFNLESRVSMAPDIEVLERCLGLANAALKLQPSPSEAARAHARQLRGMLDAYAPLEGWSPAEVEERVAIGLQSTLEASPGARKSDARTLKCASLTRAQR